jgi:hypothetical protein
LEVLGENPLKISGHHYTAQTIQISVQQIIEAGNSYRGVATTMKILFQSSSIKSSHYSSIRQWVERIGLLELMRDKKRDDWIYIVDLTLQLGTRKSSNNLWSFGEFMDKSNLRKRWCITDIQMEKFSALKLRNQLQENGFKRCWRR